MEKLSEAASRVVIARPRRGRGALSAQREEVPLGCNLGKAVTVSPIAFPRCCRVLRDCHVSLRPPRNDKSGAVTILTIHCANRPCSAGPGCPLPYKVQPGRQYRYCYIDSDYSIGQGGCQPGNNAGTS